MTTSRTATIIAFMTALMVACSPAESSGPSAPSSTSGVTPIPGGPMEPTPTPASPKVPGSQQEAHDTALAYLQKTVDGLPPGTTLDTTQAGGGSNLSCDDDYTGPGAGPTDYTVNAYVMGPPGVQPSDLIAKAGDLWHSWGLTVMERDGFEKPNQFGYPPDGYRLLIQAAYPANYPPSLTVISPCFPGDLRKDGLPIPDVIQRSNPAR